MKPEAAVAARPPDYDDDEFDEAIELSAEHAAELARGLTAIRQSYPKIACPRYLHWHAYAGKVMITTEAARWIIDPDGSGRFGDFLMAMIRQENLPLNEFAGSC